ncbi:MAG TPA: PH domain-containing protein [Candidatus Bathyarchaeota archaeon]|nr:PH domain-containing protein [Candidatus Bathyarchaeota archaeon]
MKIGEKFRPHVDFKKLYYSYLLILSTTVFLLAVLPALIAVFLYRPSIEAVAISASILFPFMLAVDFVPFWIPKYYHSIRYLFTEGEIIVEKGVWWRHKSTVPYNRITNIDVVQGPISRRFGLRKVRFQTAGYSAAGGGGAIAEASIMGVKNFDEIRDFVLKLVRGLRPVAVEAGFEAITPGKTAKEMLDELRKIREILEK